MFIDNLDRFIRFLTNTPSIESLIELEQNDPDRFEKIRQAHNKVLLKEINKQLKKSLILYFHPYTTQHIVMVDWTGERPLQMGHQEFNISSMPIDVETGRLLKAGKIIFHNPVFLHNYFTELFALVNREENYGVRIHGRQYQHPSGRIISGPTTLGEPNLFLYSVSPPFLSGEVWSSLSIAQIQEAAMRRQEERRSWLPDNLLPELLSYGDLVSRYDGYLLSPDYQVCISVRERIPEQMKEETPREEVEDLLEKIDTLLEGEDPDNYEEDYIPKVAPRL